MKPVIPNLKPTLFRIYGIVGAVFVIAVLLWFGNAKDNHSSSRVSAENASARRAQLNQALVSAVKKRDAAQVKSLLSRGADSNARDNSAYHDWQKQMAELVTEPDALTGKSKTHKRSERARPFLGPTVLMIAAYQSDDAIIQILLNAGANINAKGVEYYATSVAIGQNAYWDPTSIATIHHDADLDYQVTPFLEAMPSGKETTMNLLLKKGADVNARDSTGETALDIANGWVPTSLPPPERMQYLDRIFRVLNHAGAKRSGDLEIPFERPDRRSEANAKKKQSEETKQ